MADTKFINIDYSDGSKQVVGIHEEPTIVVIPAGKTVTRISVGPVEPSGSGLAAFVDQTTNRPPNT